MNVLTCAVESPPVGHRAERNITNLAVGLFVFALIAALAGCSRTAPSGAAAAAKRQAEPVAVTVAPVTLRPVQRTVQIVGTFYGSEEVTIAPKVEGRVLRIHHDVGDVVKPGEVLLEIDPTDYKLALEEAKKSLQLELAKLGLEELPPKNFDVRALPTVERAKYVTQNASQKVERAKKSGIGTTAGEREQLETDLSVAQAGFQQAIIEAQSIVAAARHKQAMLQTAQQRLADTLVRAPDPSQKRLALSHPKPARAAVAPVNFAAAEPLAVEYVIAERLVSEGEIVRTMASPSVFRLVIDQPLKLQATVPERYVGDVKVGLNTAIKVEAYPGEAFEGAVSRVNPTVDRTNRTFQVEVLVPNETRRLRAGSFAKASIHTHNDASAVTIPEEALVTFAGVIKVFVIENNQARAVEVKPGMRLHVGDADHGSNWLEVTGELEPDSSVVTSGHSQLADGTPVRLRSASPDAPHGRSPRKNAPEEQLEPQTEKQVSRR